MAVEIETSEAPNLQDLASGAAVAAMTGYYVPLTTPAGGTDLVRHRYTDDLSLWCHSRADAGEPAPGVVFVHGGGWGAGSPAFHFRHIHELAGRGYVGAAMEYRLSTTAPWPAQLDDVAAAVSWLRSNAEELGLDPERIAVAGGSAGGHLAAMAALTMPEVKAAVVWYPAVDLRTFHAHPEWRAMTDALLPGATVEELLHASPVGRVTADAPPFLTFAGDLDPLTTVADIERFHGLLDDVAVRNELVVFKGRDHGFDYHPADFEVCVQRMAAFLADVL